MTFFQILFFYPGCKTTQIFDTASLKTQEIQRSGEKTTLFLPGDNFYRIDYTVQQGGVWKFFLIGQRASKFSFSKNSRGLKYQHFFVKIGTKLPLTIKNKRRNTNLKFEFQNYFIFTLEKAHFWFLKKNTHKKFFLRVLALIQL